MCTDEVQKEYRVNYYSRSFYELCIIWYHRLIYPPRSSGVLYELMAASMAFCTSPDGK